jgi:hypothetical protein
MGTYLELLMVKTCVVVLSLSCLQRHQIAKVWSSIVATEAITRLVELS